MTQTLPRIDVATAMLVALDEAVVGVCVPLLDDAGYRVIRVRHVPAACERLPVAMPQLVVAPTTLPPAEAEMLKDRCVAVGAELLTIPPDVDARVLVPLLARAAHTALERQQR